MKSRTSSVDGFLGRVVIASLETKGRSSFGRFPSAPPFGSAIEVIPHRLINDAQDRCLSPHEGDVHSEFASPLDELLGAVKRVDEPEVFPVLSLLVGEGAGLLGNDGNRGVEAGQPFKNHGIGATVGLGQR